jgi:hypothetical protein
VATCGLELGAHQQHTSSLSLSSRAGAAAQAGLSLRTGIIWNTNHAVQSRESGLTLCGVCDLVCGAQGGKGVVEVEGGVHLAPPGATLVAVALCSKDGRQRGEGRLRCGRAGWVG